MVTDERASKVRRMAERRQQGVIVLEDIHDPHNAAAVFRSCEAFGFHHVYLIFEREQDFNPDRARGAAASAQSWLQFRCFDSTEACLNELKAQGYTCWATVADPEAPTVFDTSIEPAKVAMLFGNEYAGLTDTAVALADRRITIPMRGMIRSLNLSVTAALFLYELTRQRLDRGIEPYLLPDAERQRIEQEHTSSE